MVRTLFQIQELAEDVARYLERGDWARCIRVCKAWQETFAPLLYRHITHCVSYRGRASPWIGVKRHSHHMRMLTVTSSVFPELVILGPECHHLTTLTIEPYLASNQPSQWSSRIRALIDHNPFIHTLRIALQTNLYRGLFRENNILERLPALRNLAILNDTYPDPITAESNGVFEAILDYGSQLESLTYDVSESRSSWVKEADERESIPYTEHGAPTWTRLTFLSVHDEEGHRELELLKRCPQLRHYKTRAESLYDDCKSIKRLIQHCSTTPDHLSCLEHLEMARMVGPSSEATLNELLRVSARSSGLKTFCAMNSAASETVTKTLLAYHGKSLEKLVMLGTKWIGTVYLCQMTTICPRLRHLEISMWDLGPWLQDLVKSPWICTELRTLRLTARPQDPMVSAGQVPTRDEDDDDEDVTEAPWRQFWKQIGALEHLESLRLRLEQVHPTSTKMFVMEQEDIEHLCNLRRLRELHVPSGQSFMSDGVHKELRRRLPRLRLF